MYIYNVTTNIEEALHVQWLHYMNHTHIPNMLATGKIVKAKMCKVMVKEQMGGITYSVQYTLQDLHTLQRFLKEDKDRLLEDAQKRFGNGSVSFDTQLEVIGGQQHKTSRPIIETLFAYGTLQDRATQNEIFGRALIGQADKLFGFRIADHKIEGTFAIIVASQKTADFAVGTAYSVTLPELYAADRYEGDSYRRVPVQLASGITAWAYTGN